MRKFLHHLVHTLNEEANVSVTENGALGCRHTKSALLDMNFRVSSYRNQSAEAITTDFAKAFYENRLLALKWLFFARDVRGGLGERRLFRVILEDLAVSYDPAYVLTAVKLVAEYGRYDDLFCLLRADKVSVRIQKAVLKYLKETFEADWRQMQQKKDISLLAKWLPSCNTSSAETRKLAKKIREYFQLSEKEYRQRLAVMRKYLDVTEVKTCANRWGEIDYARVPSKANLLYGTAFFRHDEKRRNEFLEKVLEKGEVKMNASVLYPHDIVSQYRQQQGLNANLEALWASQHPANLGKKAASTVVVADGSGSMYYPFAGTRVEAIDVCMALAVYFAEGLTGAFHNKFITFSERPQLVDVGAGKNLLEKLKIAFSYNEVANTNLEAVFDLLLQTAVRQQAKPSELPENILILSDMEFDAALSALADEKLFQTIAWKYAAQGYKLPRLIFWNLCSRTITVPLQENSNGVVLASGFSPNMAQMMMSGELDPFKCLRQVLERPRYQPVHTAFAPLMEDRAS